MLYRVCPRCSMRCDGRLATSNAQPTATAASLCGILSLDTRRIVRQHCSQQRCRCSPGHPRRLARPAHLCTPPASRAADQSTAVRPYAPHRSPEMRGAAPARTATLRRRWAVVLILHLGLTTLTVGMALLRLALPPSLHAPEPHARERAGSGRSGASRDAPINHARAPIHTADSAALDD